MIHLEKARDILKKAQNFSPCIEVLPLLSCRGRVLAEDLLAPLDQPPFPRSPLDGYAVRGEDTRGASPKTPVIFQMIDTLYAGSFPKKEVGKGEAVRIMTGAPIPEGADTVIRQEHTKQMGSYVAIEEESAPYAFYCPMGEDFKKGDTLLRKGDVLDAAALTLAASAGFESLPVFSLPKIALLSVGDELLRPGEAPEAGKIYNSNLTYVQAKLLDLDLSSLENAGMMPDNLEILSQKLTALLDRSDLVLTTGGVSVGDKDFLRKASIEAGCSELFWKVRVKPGSPVYAAEKDGKILLCLSGNPFAAFVNFELLARPLLAAMCKNPSIEPRRLKAHLAEDIHKRAKYRSYIRGVLDDSLRVRPVHGNHKPGSIRSIVEANCLIELPAMSERSAGDTVEVLLL